MSLYCIGLSTTGHDPAVAIANPSGKIIFAESTERFLQDKRAWGAMPDQPSHLRPIINGIIAGDPAAEFQVATSWSRTKAELPYEQSDSLLDISLIQWMTSLQEQQQAFAGNNLRYIAGERMRSDVWRLDHHLCHAANAVYSAPFDDAACLVLDGEGEIGAATLFRWQNGRLARKWRSWGPGSLGAFYAWLTELCGFNSVAGEEWKVMGLAAYGTPNSDWVAKLTQTLIIEDGRIQWIDRDALREITDYFDTHVCYQGKPYLEAADLAASAQAAYSHFAQKILADVYQQTQCTNLILSGGCALNSSFNGTILAVSPFTQVHVPSAPADDGNAIGAALLAWQKSQASQSSQTKYTDKDQPESSTAPTKTLLKSGLPWNHASPYLGSSPSQKDIANLQQYAAPYQVTVCDNDAIAEVAALLAAGKIIGVMRGAAEFGPRALGNRSILADPRDPQMKQNINEIVKGREGYRPFAPVIPEQYVSEWIAQAQPSPYMSFALPWQANKQHLVPAVVHEDGTGRLQTLTDNTAPWLKALTEAFGELTNVPVLLNTSFNVMGKPIIHSVNDAVSVLMTTGLDAVLIENTLISKE